MNIFSAPRWKPNVTVAAIIERDGHYLLIEERTAEGLKLNNPAGHLEAAESPQQAVVREALEETMRAFTPEALLGVYLSRHQHAASGEDITYMRFAYCGTVGDELPGRALDAGIVRSLWMTAEEIRASRDRHRSPLLLRCVQDHLAGVRYPLGLVATDASVFEPEQR
jgi:ADP-ribose pyrophosphatase YjhB (NUDIX family)